MTNLQLRQFFKVKKPKITSHINNEFAPLVSAAPKRRPDTSNRSFRLPVQQVIISQHVVDRWNGRIGPVAPRKLLQTFFDFIFIRQQTRVQKLSHDTCLIDHEIYVVFTFTDGILKIITLYGRVSLNPSLSNTKYMRHFKLRQGDSISLDLSPEVIQQQVFPTMPSDIIHYEGSQTKYVLEVYPTTRRNLPMIILYQKKMNEPYFTQTTYWQPNQAIMTNSTLTILAELGYGEFIRQNIKHFKSELWNELTEKYSEKECSEVFKRLQGTNSLLATEEKIFQ